jgi:molybdate transport system regulatory protein
VPRHSPELKKAIARVSAARTLVNDFRKSIATSAREGKSVTDARISLEIYESALAALAKNELDLRLARRERYKYSKNPKKSFSRGDFIGTDGIKVGTRLSLRFDLSPEARIGPGKIALLEAIRSAGSISGAARAIGMSYRQAWLLVHEINHALLEPAVRTEAGGARRGGARVTTIGKRLVELYRSIESLAQAAAEDEFQAIEDLAGGNKDTA